MMVIRTHEFCVPPGSLKTAAFRRAANGLMGTKSFWLPTRAGRGPSRIYLGIEKFAALSRTSPHRRRWRFPEVAAPDPAVNADSAERTVLPPQT